MSNTADRKVQQAIALFQQGKASSAVAMLTDTLGHQPSHFGALHALAVIHGISEEHEKSIELLERALVIDPQHFFAHFNIAKAYDEIKQHEHAVEHLEIATRINPNHADSWLTLGKALNSLGKHEAGLAALEKALAIQPDSAIGWMNKGVSLIGLKHLNEATLAFDQSLQLNLNSGEAWANQAIAFALLRKHVEAGNCAAKAIEIMPESPLGWFSKGMALANLEIDEEAVECFSKAIALAPKDIEHWYHRANAYSNLKKPLDALADYEEAWKISPDHLHILIQFAYQKLMVFRWSDYDSDVAKIVDLIQSSPSMVSMFALLAFPLKGPEILRAAIASASSIDAEIAEPFSLHQPAAPNQRPSKLRIGYFSSDWNIHPVGQLTQNLFSHHDKSRFEIVGFFLTPPWDHPITENIKAQFDQWHDISGLATQEAIEHVRKQGLDIAVDLNGHTKHCRLDLFANRVAPIQTQYLGYPGTIGGSWSDYVIADRWVIPHGEEIAFTESIIRLPHSFFITHNLNNLSSTIETRITDKTNVGLPPDALVLSCFNNSYKIDPKTFESWSRILKAHPNSVLWLSPQSEVGREQLIANAKDMAISKDRLFFAPAKPDHRDHLRRLSAADIFLDTPIYNAHTTACESLMMGVPVVTCEGGAFQGRVAASMLHALNLPELITQTLPDYESLVIDLLGNTDKLAQLKQKLWRNRITAPLFDNALTARCIEAGYDAAYERFVKGLAPHHIEVQL